MTANKTKHQVSIKMERDTLKKLHNATAALSELASATITGCDDPKRVR